MREPADAMERITAKVRHWEAQGFAYTVHARGHTFTEVIAWMKSQDIRDYRTTWGFYFFKTEVEAFAFKMRWG